MTLNFVEIDLPQPLVAFKTVGDESTLMEYCANHPPTAAQIESDWTAMYLQFNEAHSLGTLPNRFDRVYASRKYEVANLLRMELSGSARAVIVLDDVFAESKMDGTDKALLLKRALGLDETRPLMAQLGERRLVLVCRETSNEWELVVPHALLTESASEHTGEESGSDDGERDSRSAALQIDRCEVVRRFKPNAFGVAAHMAIGTDGAFARFDDACIAEWRNEPPAFVQQYSSERV